jgi:hypothetical protein
MLGNFEDVYEFECYDTCIWFIITTNIIVTMMMHAMYRKELELLRKTIPNNEQPQAKGDHGKAAVEILLTRL